MDAVAHDGFAKTLKQARAIAEPTGWNFSVKVWAVGNPLVWHMDSPLIDHAGLLVFDKLKHRMPKQDYHVIDFKLQDHSGLNLRFKPNPMDAFAVATDPNNPPGCPARGKYSPSIYAISCDPSGRTLIVRNDNMNVEYFSFALYFDSDQGDQCYDPGGANQNGDYHFS